MKIFIHEIDDYVEKEIKQVLKDEHELYGTLKDPNPSEGSEGTLFLKSVIPNNSTSIKKALLDCDCIIYRLKTDVNDALFALKILLGSNYENEKTFILLSNVTTWSNTKKIYEEDEEEEEEESEGKKKKPEKIKNYEAFTEESFITRKPHSNYLKFLELEKRVRKSSNKKLNPFVLCCGFVYGKGENIFHNWFKKAWMGSDDGVVINDDSLIEPKTIECFYNGENYLPLIHVVDLANIVKKLVNEPPNSEEEEESPTGGSYIIAVDDSQLKLKEILESIKKEFKCEKIKYLKTKEEVLIHENNDKLTIDVKFQPGTVSNYEFDWVSKEGFKKNIKKIRQEYQQIRNLSPLKIGVYGPPGSGKSKASELLSKKYKIPYLRIDLIIKEFFEQQEKYKKQLNEMIQEKERKKKEKEELKNQKKDKKEGEENEENEDEEEEEEEQNEEEEEEGEENENSPINILKKRIQIFENIKNMKIELSEEELKKVGIMREIAPHRLNSKALSIIFQWKMNQKECLNKGWIIDGFPRNKEETKLLLKKQKSGLEIKKSEDEEEEEEEEEEEGEEGEEGSEGTKRPLKAKKAYLPEFIIALNIDEKILEKRIATLSIDAVSGENQENLEPEQLEEEKKKIEFARHWTEDNYKRRLELYKKNFSLDDEGSVFSLLEEATATDEVKSRKQPVLLKELKYDEKNLVSIDKTINDIMKFIGEPHNYGLSKFEILELEKEKLKEKEKIELIEKEKIQKLKDKEEKEKLRQELIKNENAKKLKEISQQEKEMLHIRSQPLRQFLMENVMPTLTKGLVEICQVHPKDPIDYLSEFLWRESEKFNK